LVKTFKDLHSGQSGVKTIAGRAVILLAAGFSIDTVLDASGQLHWQQLMHPIERYVVNDNGIVLQISICLFLVLAALLLSTLSRLARLERLQKTSALSLPDIATAYRLSHAADRKGAFALVGEFDQMRLRMDHLRNHPDLQDLQDDLLQIAAQMSMQTRDLARIYSDENVKGATDFLRQRQLDVQALSDQLTIARTTCDELLACSNTVDADDDQIRQHIEQLEHELKDILPSLGFSPIAARPRHGNVVALQKAAN
jgi:hypothetical protein